MAMIFPLMAGCRYFAVHRRGWAEDRGDVVPTWSDEGEGVYAGIRSLPEAREGTEDGETVSERMRLVLPWMGRPVATGDLMVAEDGTAWEVLETTVRPMDVIGVQSVIVEVRP